MERYEFVAEGAHREPPVEELETVLDLYEQRLAELPDDDEVVQLQAQEQFILDFNSFRERELRGALEEVAWRLARRSHHVWLEDEGISEAPPRIETDAASPSIARPLSLCLVPARANRLGGGPSRITFAPDVHGQRVAVSIDVAEGQGSGVQARGFALDELDERTIIELAVGMVGPVLLGDVPRELAARRGARSLPLEEAEVPDERQWADTGLVGRSAPRDPEGG